MSGKTTEMTLKPQAGGGTRDPHPTLVTYAILTGLTPLIPIPFLDDVARDYSRRRLVEGLAAARGIPLPGPAVEALIAEPKGCLAGGCLSMVLIFPFKLIFRKLFMFLEWKRSLDLTSHTYHFGYLVDCALQDGYLRDADPTRVSRVRTAIEAVCREAPVKPVESAVAATFRQSRAVLNGAVAELVRAFQGPSGRVERARVKANIGTAEEQEAKRVAGVAEALQERLRAIPDSHFQWLRDRLRHHLG